MSMERPRCKLCSRTFMNGRALGGHMRSHLAALPLPVKKSSKQQECETETESESSSTRSQLETKLGGGSYELRGNPKRSVKGLDHHHHHHHHEFMDAVSSMVVQDRESETESTQNPTRRRSKRSGQRAGFQPKRCKWGAVSESGAESTQVSSVSDPSCQDEEVALCLMMLSRDVWENDSGTGAERKTGRVSTRPVAKFKCLGCKKVFRTGRALEGHKASNKECCQESFGGGDHVGQKIFECPFCYKVFGSGQALGGHKRSHLVGSGQANNNVASNNNTTTTTTTIDSNVDYKVGDTTTTTTSFVLDLNLPAPVEDNDDNHSGSGQFCRFSMALVEVE